MFGRSIATITACALGASALILPPGIAPASNDDVLFPVIANPKYQAITLPCPSCAFPSTAGKLENTDELADDLLWIQGGANNIMVNFTVSEDGRNLEMGGVSIYPAVNGQPKVDQVSSSASIAEVESGDATTVSLHLSSFNVAFEPTRLNVGATEDGHSITTLRVFGMSFDDQSLPLQEVAVTMLEMDDGEILILNVESTVGHRINAPHHGSHMGRPDRRPFHRPGGPAPHGKGMHKECGMLPAPLCKLKHAIEAKVLGMDKGGRSPCHGRKGKHTNPWMDKDGHVKLPTHIKGPKFHMGAEVNDVEFSHESSFHHHPHKEGHHGRHGRHGRHGHHHRHGFFHAFVKGFIAVLIPVMAGVTVGMAVSFVGLAFGRLITFVWIKFVRGGRRDYASVALTEDTAETRDLKVDDFADKDAPPMYEDAPKYEAGAYIEVKEEK